MHLINGKDIFLDFGENYSTNNKKLKNILFSFKLLWQKQLKQSVENDMKN
jgi:hypothetical protein